MQGQLQHPEHGKSTGADNQSATSQDKTGENNSITITDHTSVIIRDSKEGSSGIQERTINFGQELTRNLRVNTNLDQDVIATTVDKAHIVLTNYSEAVKAQGEWITPLGFMLTFITTLVSADFKEALGLTPNVWKAIFVICVIGSSVWLCKSLWRFYKTRGCAEIDFVIKKLRNEK